MPPIGLLFDEPKWARTKVTSANAPLQLSLAAWRCGSIRSATVLAGKPAPGRPLLLGAVQDWLGKPEPSVPVVVVQGSRPQSGRATGPS
jgi:hypothetical protein